MDIINQIIQRSSFNFTANFMMQALIVTWDCGKISVHDIEMFEDTYGSCTNELLHGRPRVSTSLTFEGYLALECELVFVSPNGDVMYYFCLSHY